MDGGLAGFEPFMTQESFATLLERARALPGVEAVGLGRYVPLGVEGSQRRVQVPGYEPGTGESMNIRTNVVGPGYFAAMGIPMVEGREFLESEAGARVSEGEREVAVGGTPYSPPEANDAGEETRGRSAQGTMTEPEGNAGGVPDASPTPVVVNQSFARRFWPDGSPLGRTFDAGGVLSRIVGVAADGKYQRLGEEPMPFFYLPWPRFRSDVITLHVRTAGDPKAVLSGLRLEAEAVAPGLALYDVETMDDHLAWALLPARAAALALGGFGLLCVILLSVGVHGVVSLSVGRRTREVGVRLALGASPRNAARMVMSEEGRVVMVGLAFGLVGAFVVARILDRILYAGHGLDPRVFLGAPLLLAAVAAAAAWGPARRAATIDPAQALREE
jgi:hypothetical protein